MKILLFKISAVIVLAFLFSCGSRVADENKDKAAQLADYREDMVELRKKISELENELKDAEQGVVFVELQELHQKKFEHFIDVMGHVRSDQNLLVSPETAGNIISINVKEGARVKKGQVLGRLNTNALDKSIQETEVNYDLAKTVYERQERLWQQQIGSEVEYLQAKSNMESLGRRLDGLKAQRPMAVISAPINGVVDEVIQNEGEMAGPTIPFARIVNLDHVYITSDVSETYLNRISEGDMALVRFPVLDVEREVAINRISSVINPDSRTFRLRVDMDNPGNSIRPNLMAVTKLRVYSNPNAIVVPSILIRRDFTGDFLFVAEQQGNHLFARKRYIETGLNNNNNTVVTSGLNEGDKIIVEGYAQVVDGTPLEL